MKVIGFLAQNKQDMENILPIMSEISKRGNAHPIFISLDAFFHQGCEQILQNYKVDIHRIEPKKAMKNSFYLLSMPKKLRVIIENRRRIRNKCDDINALVCSSDGALERIFINKMRHDGKKTYLLLNGLIIAEEQNTLKENFRRIISSIGLSELFPSEIGQGGCSKIFVPGEYVRQQLIKRNLPRENIFVTGIPRFGPLAERMMNASSIKTKHAIERQKSIYSIMYLMGAWDWHRDFLRSEQEWLQLQQLDEIIGRWSDKVSLTIRTHPRSSQREIDRLGGLYHAAVTDAVQSLEESITSVDAILAVVSTGLLEAIAAQKLAIIIDLNCILHEDALEPFRQAGIVCVTEIADFEFLVDQIVHKHLLIRSLWKREENAFRIFVSAKSVNSHLSITDIIENDLNSTN
jgi:hypothetical protein